MVASTSESATNGRDPLVPSDGTGRFSTHDREVQPKGKTASNDEGSKLQEGTATVASSAAEVVVLDPAAVTQEEGMANPETWSFVYGQLVRQLEYYFSEKNLSKDTYLQTLRQLNDGCVPVSILANFAMVKRLVTSLTFVIDEEGRLAAVQEAAQNYSERLMVCLIDTKTGKRVSDEEAATPSDSSCHFIMAVGTVSGKPLVLDSSIPQPSPIVKTIVLRDVVEGVTPEEIHELFDCEEFPPVTCIHPDVANCWFVTLDTEDKSDVLQVLMSLRGMTLRDHPVHARIKSTVAKAVVDTAPVMPWVPPVPELGGEPAKRKKKKIRGKKKKGSANISNATAGGKRGKKELAKPTPPPPPTLGEENFPTLQDKTVEVDTAQVMAYKTQSRRGSNASEPDEDYYYDEDERNDKPNDVEDDKDERKSMKTMSDGASTATTTSSSLESVPKKTFPTLGYAAALMGKAGKSITSQDDAVRTPSAQPSADSKAEVPKVPEDKPVSTSLAPKSEYWGGRRSFADILRVSQESATSASS